MCEHVCDDERLRTPSLMSILVLYRAIILRLPLPGAKRSFFTTLRVVSTFLGERETGRERRKGGQEDKREEGRKE